MKEIIIKLLRSDDDGDQLLAIEMLKNNYNIMIEILPLDKPIDGQSQSEYGSFRVPLSLNLSGIVQFINKEFSLLIGRSSYAKILNSDINSWEDIDYPILDKIIS